MYNNCNNQLFYNNNNNDINTHEIILFFTNSWKLDKVINLTGNAKERERERGGQQQVKSRIKTRHYTCGNNC